MSDHPDPPAQEFDLRFADVREESRATDRRIDALASEMRYSFELVLGKLVRLVEGQEQTALAIKDINERLERVLSGIEGYDIRKRLAAVEETVQMPKPRRAGAKKVK